MSRLRLRGVTATTVAATMSLLLVGSVGPVYADDGATAATTTASTASTTTSPADPTPTTDPTTTPTDSPATPDPTNGPTAAPSTTEPTAQPITHPTTQPTSGQTATTGGTRSAKTASTMLQAPSAVTLSAATPPSNPSWIWQGGAPTLDDGEKDATAYSNGASESTDPQTWGQGTSSSPNNDLLKYYLNTDTSSGDIVTSFGFTRAATSGDTAFAAELNQAANYSNTPEQPHRTTGDLLMRFNVHGNDPLTFQHAYLWEPTSAFAGFAARYPGLSGCTELYSSGSGWCEIPTGGFQSRVADSGFTAEGRIDLTELFSHVGCSAVFNVVNLRSTSSAENWTNSLKDYLPLSGVSVPSTCSSIVIHKQDLAGNPVGGATFTITPDPSSPSGSGSVTVKDDDSSDLDPAAGVIRIGDVQPGSYTVTETAAPPGYLLADPASQTLPVGKSTTVTFTFKDPRQWQDLAVSSSVTSATWTRTYDWLLGKGVRAGDDGPFGPTASRTIPAGQNDDTVPFGYRLTATENGSTDSGWDVQGKVTVTNPNSDPVTVQLADRLSDGTACTFASDTVSVPGDGQPHGYAFDCSYAKAPASLGSGTSTATVTWSRADYPQSQSDVGATGSNTRTATAGYTWTETSVHKSVTITDDRFDFGGTGSWQLTYGVGGTDGVHTTTYSRDVRGSDGTCVDSRNTATLTADDDPGYTKTAGATATVCVGSDLQVAKNAVTSLTRSYGWQLTKTAEDGKVDVDPTTGHALVHYRVQLKAAGYTDSLWHMAGQVTVTNPNTFQDVTMSSLVDVYTGDGGSAQPVLCAFTDTAGRMTVPAGKSQVYHYTCTFTGKPDYDGTNTATATWAGTDQTVTPDTSAQGTASVTTADWSLDQEVDKTVSVYDDGGQGGSGTMIGGPYTWSDDFSTTIDYTEAFTTAPGSCRTVTNTAWAAAGSAGSADAADAVPGTSSWAGSTVCAAALTLVKKVDNGVDGTASPADWTLTATPSTGAPVSGNGDPNSQGGVSEVLVSPGTFALSESGGPTGYTQVGWSCVDASGQQISTTDSVRITSGADVTCTVTNAKEGTWTIEKTSDPRSGAQVLPGDTISYTLTVQRTGGVPPTGVVVVDDLSDVVDHTSAPTILWSGQGTASYDAASGRLTWDVGTLASTSPVTLTYSVKVDADAVGVTLRNHVTGAGSSDCPPDPVVESPDCRTVHHTPAWTLLKTSDPASGSQVQPGQTVSYTLLVANTGPAKLQDAVVHDDLSDVLDHATWNDDATTASGTATLSGDSLTWRLADVAKGGTATLTYSVTVDQDAWGETLRNLAAPASPGGSCATDGGCETEHPVPPATGQLSITKTQYRLGPDGVTWEPMADTATVHYGDEVKYVLDVGASGPRRFHDVTISDYVPGYNPADTTSTAKATLVPGSAACTGDLTCTVSTDTATGLVTWTPQDPVTAGSGTAEFVVRFPQLPVQVPYDGDGNYTTTLWNVGTLSWTDTVPGSETGTPQSLTSNAVVVSATQHQTVSPPVTPPKHHPGHPGHPGHDHGAPPPPQQPAVLPNTGGPRWWVLPVGIGLLLAGAGLMLGEEAGRRRRA